MTSTNTEKLEATHLFSQNGSMDSIINNTIINNKYILNIYKYYYSKIEDLQLHVNENSSIGMSSSSQILKHSIESESNGGVE